MVAAARMVISAHEPPPSHRQLSRALPIYPNGVHAYDLMRELERRGWSALHFTGPPEAIARLVEAGFGVIAMVTSKRGRHSVAVTGAERLPDVAEPNQCGRALYRLLINDPNHSKAEWITARDFAAQQSGQQAMVIFKPESRGTLSAKRFPLEVAARIDRRFRAQTLYERSLLHPQPNSQQRAMLLSAIKQDPCYAPPREMLHIIEHALGVVHIDLPACHEGGGQREPRR